MKKLYLVFTVLFLFFTAALWINSFWLAGTKTTQAQNADKSLTWDQVSSHNRVEDCWMAIGGSVYDLTSYLPKHPTSLEIIVPYCGKDATAAYETKNLGRNHSSYADELLRSYRIGVVSK